MNGKKITFNGDLDSFKTKDKGVTIQIKTTTDHLSLDKLSDIADGDITVYLESSQLELIDELDGEFEAKDIAKLDKLHSIDSDGYRETIYTATTKDGSVYGLTEDLYENIKLQMPEEPEKPVDIDDVPADSNFEPENDNNDEGEKMDLFKVNPETNTIEQVTEQEEPKLDFRCDYCDKKMSLSEKAIYSDLLSGYFCSLKCLLGYLDIKVDTVNELIADESRDFYESKN